MAARIEVSYVSVQDTARHRRPLRVAFLDGTYVVKEDAESADD